MTFRVAEEHLQGGGTFDSSGAFRDERWSDEDDGDGKKRRVLRKRVDPSHDGIAGAEDSGGNGTAVAVDSPSKASDDVQEQQLPDESVPTAVAVQAGAQQTTNVISSTPPVQRGPSPESTLSSQPTRVEEDGLEHAQSVVSTLVAQLVEDEDQPKPSLSPPNPPLNLSMDQWFYRFISLFCLILL